MSLLNNRKVLLGISGSIAAYKSAHLVRELIKRGAEVQVVMTHAAKDFVTPLTLATLSKRPVYSDFIEEEQKPFGVWNNHVEMGLWADFMIIAPASSNTLSKLVSGAADNLLTAVYLSAKCPVLVAPAMDLDMYRNGATTSNLALLQERGVSVIESEVGELASGLYGQGRMAEPEHIADFLEAQIRSTLPLAGKTVLVNAGPTHEHIDPVRFIGNNSTGLMGASLAQAAYALGAEVHLVLGPTQKTFNLSGISVYHVISAAEMWEAMKTKFSEADLTICSAAVADYRPQIQQVAKIKKENQSSEELEIKLVHNRDILKSLGEIKTAEQYLVGFALETENGAANARAKLIRKNADAIILNELGKKGVGFESETNEVNVYFKEGSTKSFDLQEKRTLAHQLLSLFIREFQL